MNRKLCFLIWGKELPLRYLPSFVVFGFLLVVLVFADQAQVRDFEQAKRQTARAMLQVSHDRLRRVISVTLRNVRNLGRTMKAAGTLDQAEFDALVDAAFGGRVELVRAEYAPGYRTQMVTPLEGNQDHIGHHPIPSPQPEPDESGFDPARGQNVAISIRVEKTGQTTLKISTPTRDKQEVNTLNTGLMHVVVRLDLAPPTPAKNDTLGPVEVLYILYESGSPNYPIPQDWDADGQFSAEQVTTYYPWGTFETYIRAIKGWEPNADQLVKSRLLLMGLGLLVLLPVALANRFALSQVATQSHLDKTQDKLGSVLKDLPGVAMIVTWPPGATRESDRDKAVFLNKDACFQIWGVEAEDVEADINVLRAVNVNSEETEQLNSSILKAALDMKPWHTVWPIQTPAGEHRWLEARGHPTRLPDGSTRWTSITVDATQEVKSHQELEHQREQAEKLHRRESLSRLTGGVAHDFNNILAVILGSLELMQDDEISETQREILTTAIDATLKGADLTRNMLAFSRQAPLEAHVLDLNDVLRNTKIWVRRTIPENIKIETSLLAGLWKVKADESSTISAFLNLVINARDAMPDGGKITVETSNVRVDSEYISARGEDIEPGRYVLVAVSDTGTGIPASKLEQIFEPFFTTKDPGSGTGLGLSMILGFMKQSAGTILVYSEVGTGTTFKLYFPEFSGHEALHSSTIEAPHSKPTTNAKLLLVEDEPEILAVLSSVLSREGYQIQTAISGDEAAKIFEANPDFDLVITDIIMPGELQGTSLLRHLRDIRPNLPVIFMSGYASEATVHGNGLRPEDTRLMKPIRKRDLVTAIERALTRGDASID